jgi:hypothetical protein
LTFNRASEIYQKYLDDSGKSINAESALLEFLGWDEPQSDDFARDVRIVLVSANFSKELTTSVMWLNERNLNIRCVRLRPYKYMEQILVDVQQIIPLPEAESYQIKIKQQTQERREAIESSKDYTRYIFNGAVYNKRKLVLATIKDWIAKHAPNTFSELLTAFPQELRSGGMFVTASEGNEIYKRQGIPRHFLAADELIKFPDSSVYALSNQWGKGNIETFIAQAKNFGYDIEETT